MKIIFIFAKGMFVIQTFLLKKYILSLFFSTGHFDLLLGLGAEMCKIMCIIKDVKYIYTSTHFPTK